MGDEAMVDVSTEAELRALRARLWESQTWDPGALPSHAQLVMSARQVPESPEERERHDGPAYARGLYR